ncbi:acyltransferase [Parabacteroides sp.]|uniref:acyltransferase n=1 Tax=Parabacteroides sp. TaxID=1869337 RepID=UPI00257E8BF1|nr:acyltransferase [Parabacteroides sp.]
MNTVLNGYVAQLVIGHHVSFAQNVNVMVDSGPNASEAMQEVFPLRHGSVRIGNHCRIGASVIIMPNVTLGNFCVIVANSFVNKSFPAYSIIGGMPANLIRMMTQEEIEKINKSKKI